MNLLKTANRSLGLFGLRNSAYKVNAKFCVVGDKVKNNQMSLINSEWIHLSWPSQFMIDIKRSHQFILYSFTISVPVISPPSPEPIHPGPTR